MQIHNKAYFTYSCPSKSLQSSPESLEPQFSTRWQTARDIISLGHRNCGCQAVTSRTRWQRAQAICCLYCNSLLKKGSVYNLHVWNCYSFKFQIGSAKNTYWGTRLGIHLEFKYGSSPNSLKILHANYKYMSIFPRTLFCWSLQASISFTWDSEEFQFCQNNFEISP